MSSLAKHRDVTEARILDLNPSIQGSKDLHAGMSLKLAAPSIRGAAARTREAAESLSGRVKSYAKEAGQSIEGAAETVTHSVENFIQRNPDLHQRARKLDQGLNIRHGYFCTAMAGQFAVRPKAPGIDFNSCRTCA